jgi:hypothetical protein
MNDSPSKIWHDFRNKLFLKLNLSKNVFNKSWCPKLMFACNRGDTIQYHSGLRSRELGQAPMLLVFLTPRQALSSQPRQQMV